MNKTIGITDDHSPNLPEVGSIADFTLLVRYNKNWRSTNLLFSVEARRGGVKPSECPSELLRTPKYTIVPKWDQVPLESEHLLFCMQHTLQQSHENNFNQVIVSTYIWIYQCEVLSHFVLMNQPLNCWPECCDQSGKRDLVCFHNNDFKHCITQTWLSSIVAIVVWL